MESKKKTIRDEKKQLGRIKRFLASFKNSYDGLKYAYKFEQSMTVHFISCVIVFSLLIITSAPLVEWCICLLLLGLIAATELINTSLEAVTDLVTKEIHPLAKITKDCASAAVFVFSLAAFICYCIMFLPDLLRMIGWC